MSDDSKYYSILTKIGKAEVANATALGKTVTLTKMALGDGGGAAVTPTEDMAALTNEVYRAEINTLAVENDVTMRAELVVPTDEGGWYVREVGLFDEDGQLFAVASLPETYKPALSQGAGRELTIILLMEISDSESITLKIDPTVILATRGYVDDSIDAHNSDEDAHGGHAALTDNPHGVTIAQAAAAGNLLNKAIEEPSASIDGDIATDTALKKRNRFACKLTDNYELPVLTPPFESEWVIHIYPNGNNLTLASGWSDMLSGEPDSDATLVRLNLSHDSIGTTLVVQNITKGA